MKPFVMMTTGLVGMMAVSVMAGEASTSAWANNAGLGNAGAIAQYNGQPGNLGIARTDTRTGTVNLARGLAVGVDADGLDFSFSHAIAPNGGPAYAGTLNLSIGRNGEVNGSYGGVLSQGGVVRNVESGGSTSSRIGGTPTAIARGDATPGGRVTAQTNTFSRPPVRYARVNTSPRGYPRYR